MILGISIHTADSFQLLLDIPTGFGIGSSLKCICANRRSGRVLQKIGLRREGHLRAHMKKYGAFEDVIVYGILREEYLSAVAQKEEADECAITEIQNLQGRTCSDGLLPAVLGQALPISGWRV